MILNRQRRVPIPVENLEEFFSRARRMLHLSADSITVCFVTNSEITRWNRVYRGKNRPTDVLSFPADAAPGKHGGRRSKSRAPGYLGDIAIAPAIALRNARLLRRPFDDEIRV